MSERKRQGVVFLFLSLALSAFLTGHDLVVEAEFNACFENFSASINGERPHLRVAEMSFGQLAYAAGRQFSPDDLIVSALGLLPLAPFLIAWMDSRDRRSRQLWLASAVITLIAIVGWTLTVPLTEFYDCDLNGVSLEILAAPILYTAMTLAAALVLALLRSVMLLVTGE